MKWPCLALLLAGLTAAPSACADEVLRIGSKRFTESYILGEVLLRAVRDKTRAEHSPGLGNTGIVFAALKSGSIDLYPEYTGTIAREILKLDGNPGLKELDALLAPLGLGVSVAMGFNNGYALGMREESAARLSIRSISDLARQARLRLGLSQEFLARADGWPGLARAYRLPQSPVSLDHGLAYEALAAGRIDVTDLYSTDAKVEKYALRVLADDRGYFPRYEAVILHRLDVPRRFPDAWRALAGLEGKIDERGMIRLNAAAELQGMSFRDAAALAFPDGGPRTVASRSFVGLLFASDFARLTREHLLLTFASLALAAALGVPLAVLAARVPATAQWILGAAGVIQTVPSLALLAFLIALVGTIGTVPALIALFLYALLPIVRNTHAGLVGIGGGMLQAALALGLNSRDRLWLIELPLALPSILAGVKTSAVINVGTATIAAFIGAGGYGERIASGLALNDHAMLLAGALPAAGLALLMQGIFELAEWRFSWMAKLRRR